MKLAPVSPAFALGAVAVVGLVLYVATTGVKQAGVNAGAAFVDLTTGLLGGIYDNTVGPVVDAAKPAVAVATAPAKVVGGYMLEHGVDPFAAIYQGARSVAEAEWNWLQGVLK